MDHVSRVMLLAGLYEARRRRNNLPTIEALNSKINTKTTEYSKALLVSAIALELTAPHLGELSSFYYKLLSYSVCVSFRCWRKCTWLP